MNRIELRRVNLQKLVDDRFQGNKAALSRAAEIHPNHVNLVLTPNKKHQRNLGEGLAREIEKKLGLAEGWLDEEHAASEREETIQTPWVKPDERLSMILKLDPIFKSAEVFTLGLDTALSRHTGLQNLAFGLLATDDGAPGLARGDRVLIDTAVRAVTGDGYYILVRGSSAYLRHIGQPLTGGWKITASGGDSTIVDSLKGIEVIGRIAASWTLKVL